jgi:hypothetical protein
MTIFKHVTLRSSLLAATLLASPLFVAMPPPAAAQIAIDISVQTAPPELAVDEQPAMQEVGDIWTPGYWGWAQEVGYYWVPGSWVQPPAQNVLWTPPYWGWANGAYLLHEGYWGQTVGYYGGVNYGYGYGGNGYEGGRWQNGRFAYNQSVNNFGSAHVTDVYTSNVTVVNNTRVSYNGGTGGLRTEPTAAQRQVEQEHHTPMTTAQTSYVKTAAANPAFAASHNGGHPVVPATTRVAQPDAPGVAHAEHPGANDRADTAKPADRAAARPGEMTLARPVDHAAARPGEMPAARPAAQTAVRPGEVTPSRPEEHTATRPAEMAPARPAAQAAVRPAEMAPARPEEHAAPRPAEMTPARPAEHAVARPAEMAPVRPAEHMAARPAEPAAPHPGPEAPHPAVAQAAPPHPAAGGHAEPGKKEER